MALDLVVSGATGRMGRTLGHLIEGAEDLRALGGIARDTGERPAGYPEVVDVADATELVRRAEVVLDFSAPDYLTELLDRCDESLAGRALLVGTTGLDDALRSRLRDLAGSAAVLVAANFSVGINLLLELVERAARALPADRYDIEVVETHHRRKEDAPSGTAIALGGAAAAGRGASLEALRQDGRSGRTGARPDGQIGFHALRGGDVVGEHAVHLIGERERIVLGHSALTRELFATGALEAARWAAGQGAGWYEMADVLGLD